MGGILPDWQIKRDIRIEPFEEGRSRPGVISYGLTSYGYDVRVADCFKVFEPYTQVAHVTDISAAWVAGIIDGEGHIRTDVGGQQRALHLSVANTNKEMLEQLRDLFQTGQIYEKKKAENYKQGYEWVVTKIQHIQEILIRVLPYLTIKRQAAQEALSKTYPRAGLPMPIIDPKNCPPRAFVDVSGQGYCIIPPNSFALAETVEYLEIPRDILCICVGKSTFARCGIIVNVTPLEPEWRGKITIEISNTAPLPAKVYAGEGIAQILFLRGTDVCRVSYADKKGKYQDQKGLTLPFVVGDGPRT